MKEIERSYKDVILAKIEQASTEADLIQIAAKDSPYIYFLPDEECKAVVERFCLNAGLASKICFFEQAPTSHAKLFVDSKLMQKALEEFVRFAGLYRKTVKNNSSSYLTVGNLHLDMLVMILADSDLIQIANILHQKYKPYLPRHNKDKNNDAVSERKFVESLPELKTGLIAAFDFAKTKDADLHKYEYLISR